MDDNWTLTIALLAFCAAVLMLMIATIRHAHAEGKARWSSMAYKNAHDQLLVWRSRALKAEQERDYLRHDFCETARQAAVCVKLLQGTIRELEGTVELQTAEIKSLTAQRAA